MDTAEIIREFADRQAIADLIIGYCFNFDNNEPEAVAGLFTDDASVDYGPESATAPNRFVDDNLMVGEVGRLMSIPQTGTHRLHGVFMLSGPGIVPDSDLGETGIMDLAPTLLHLLGLPVPEDMDGHVVQAAFTDEAPGSNYIRHDLDREPGL